MTNIISKFKYYIRRKKLKNIRKKQQKEFDQNGHNKAFMVNNYNIEVDQSLNSKKSNRFSVFSSKKDQKNRNTIKAFPNPPNNTIQIHQQDQENQNISPPIKSANLSKSQQLEKPLPKCPSPKQQRNSESGDSSSSQKPESPSFDDQMSEYKRLQKERYMKMNPLPPTQPVNNVSTSPSNNGKMDSPTMKALQMSPVSLSTSNRSNTKSVLRSFSALNTSQGHLKKSGKLKVNTSEYQDIYISSKDGGLWINDLPLKIKGINWFGCETETFVVHGLWKRDFREYINFLAENNFNLVRIPFSLEMVLKDPFPTSITISSSMNTEFFGQRALSVLDIIIEACSEKGIFILLDLHSFGPNNRLNDGLWYNSKYSEQDTLKVWNILILRYGNTWNVLGVDLKNEPFAATWSTGNLATDWDQAINRIGTYIQNNGGSRWLILAQGVSSQKNSEMACCWGESFESEGRNGTSAISLPMDDKFVYSPHCYGPSVMDHSHFRNDNFPHNLPPHWDMNFGDLPVNTRRAMVVSEWGGKYDDILDKQWMDSFVSYLISKGCTDNIFWALNPNSGDTGGILRDDWTSPNNEKLELLTRLVNHPTKVSYDKDTSLYKVVSIIPTQLENA
ncbi:hypothetical protein DLAC_02748 [Tieghemostelium lacteum]|uniref:Glycoside hydrolase family 5 domain-containing protein n=1 Tax=Tieghemostelium lacteum TaxID=361077 RepID=A0A152A386_TIELA|nr:hypothetical protein DLAC_02748 [Tieghemostelium lacteum]|eukprot:KYR00708.1 hypothetical protein DLAC_02748 [Tieghemostelium lacteum]